MTCHVNDLGDTIKYRYYYNQLTDVEYPRYPANNVHYQYGTTTDAATNAVGKIIFQEDASGFQTFKYGKLGEVTENIRTFALPFESQTYTFKMQYCYDSWNRIDSMFYPDGEVVTYSYNLGGMLKRVSGSRPNRPCRYIDSICYNEFELKSEVFYGNGTHTQYAYDDLQRLQTLRCRTAAGDDMQDITYTYNAVSNIVEINNSADLPGAIFGGTYRHGYEYDNLYRLTYTTGLWEDRSQHLRLADTVQMSYHKNGRIIRKKVFANTLSPTHMGVTNYNRQYSYNTQHPNALASMFDSISHTTHRFTWQSTGNLLTHTIPERRNMMEHSWTEDNRLQTVTDNNWFSYYQYDASGERTYKLPCGRTAGNRSGERSVYWYPAEATLYASPYLVITPQGYTKHYYAEEERISSQIGCGTFPSLTTPVTDTSTDRHKLRSADSLMRALNPNIMGATAQFAYLVNSTIFPSITNETYWYHPDHLGSSSWITDANGKAVQHLHYLPWGEDFVDQRQNFFDGVRYTFSAKEKDSETGLSYFGSRYYSSDLSIWLSVDPMSDKYPSLSPYSYCANNPVKLVDPNGETFVGVDGENVEVNRNKNGQISVGDNASEDLKRMASMINSSGSKTAAKQFMKLSKNECKIHFQIVQGDGDGGKLGYHQAHGENGEPLEWNADQGVFSDLPGYANNTTYKEATITIFENAVDKSKGQFSYQDKKPLTTENAMVAVFAHEAEHNLNKLDILSIKYATVGGGMNSRNVERNAERVENKTLREIYYAR